MCDFHSDPPHWPLSSCNDWREENRTWNRYTVMTTTKRCYIPSHMPLLLTVAKSRLPAPLPPHQVRFPSSMCRSAFLPLPPPLSVPHPLFSSDPSPAQLVRPHFRSEGTLSSPIYWEVNVMLVTDAEVGTISILCGQCYACRWPKSREGHDIHIVRSMSCLSLT